MGTLVSTVLSFRILCRNLVRKIVLLGFSLLLVGILMTPVGTFSFCPVLDFFDRLKFTGSCSQATVRATVLERLKIIRARAHRATERRCVVMNSSASYSRCPGLNSSAETQFLLIEAMCDFSLSFGQILGS
jgi:hypothetical protein